MKVILMHGKDTNPTDKWYPWFKKELQKNNIEVEVPALPSPQNPSLKEWLFELAKLQPNKNTVLVGHSRGGVAILRYLERLPANAEIKKVILLGTNSGDAKYMARPQETNKGFYTEEGYDFDKIKSHCNDFVVFHSQDDHIVPFNHGEENAKGLNAKFITFTDKRHFGVNEGIVPGLLEEILNKANK